jgi:hypothetical protein
MSGRPEDIMSRIHLRLAASLLMTAPVAHAQVVRIVIDSVVSPAFGGSSYGSVGQYETIVGRAFGELDPNDRRNRVITDLQLAPRNSRGRVEYVATFFIVKADRPVEEQPSCCGTTFRIAAAESRSTSPSETSATSD